MQAEMVRPLALGRQTVSICAQVLTLVAVFGLSFGLGLGVTSGAGALANRVLPKPTVAAAPAPLPVSVGAGTNSGVRTPAAPVGGGFSGGGH